jgi:hypothetical protein
MFYCSIIYIFNSSNENMKRRGLIAILAAGLVFQGCSSSVETRILERDFIVPENINSPMKLNEANGFLFDLENVPGAGRVRKYLTSDAKYCLVHIRQAHITGGMDIDRKKEIRKVQDDIYKILSCLSERYCLNEVYCEGISNGTEALANKVAQNVILADSLNQRFMDNLADQIRQYEVVIADDKLISLIYPDVNEAEKYRGNLRSGIERKKVLLNELISRKKTLDDLKSDQLVRGAPFILACEGKISLLAAERDDIYNQALSTLKKVKGNLLTRGAAISILDDREDALLETIAGRKDRIAVVVLGGGHAFGGRYSFGENYISEKRISVFDNIAKWNNSHPTEKFSLIEITPESYDLD